MGITMSFKLALKSLATSKMRSFLTMLGIIIGVAAVIILVSLVDGYKKTIVDQFESMGTNLLNVTITSRNSNRTVSYEDLEELTNESDVLQYVSPLIQVRAIPKFGTETSDTSSIVGVNEEYYDIKHIEMKSGRFIQYMDCSTRAKNCVIGTYIANEYFPDTNPVGETLKIMGNTYTIIGVMDETAKSEEGSDDDRVIIPYTLARSLGGSSFMGSYVLSVKDKDDSEKGKQEVENFLYKTFGSDSNYNVMSMAAILDTVNELIGNLQMILVGIAGISLLVGGIGIMNIMLVSVTERTREIGIRKSLGAKRKDILGQFVVEAATTSAVGGVIGILLGICASVGVSKALDMTPVVSGASILSAFTVSAIIGITFGYFPAKKAAKLNPIEALRYD